MQEGNVLYDNRNPAFMFNDARPNNGQHDNRGVLQKPAKLPDYKLAI